MTHLLALSLLLQSPSDDILRNAGIKAEATVEAKNGRVDLPGGISVEFLGACRLNAKPPKPWGMDGGYVDAPTTQWFWHALGSNPKNPKDMAAWRGEPDGRNFAVAFRIKGDASTGMPSEKLSGLDISRSAFRPPDLALGYRHKVDSHIFAVKGKSFDFHLEVESKASKDLLTLDPDGTLPEGFDMEIKSDITEGFSITDKKERRFKIRRYGIVLTVPKSWKGIPLRLRASDHKPASNSPDPTEVLSSSSGMEGGEVDPRFKGKTFFMLQALERPNYKRTFVLFAKPTYNVVFKGIPTTPK